MGSGTDQKKIPGVIGMIIAIGLFKTVFNMNDSTILLISTISGTASFVPVAFANQSWMIYCGATVGGCFELKNYFSFKMFWSIYLGIFQPLVLPMAISVASQVLEPHEVLIFFTINQSILNLFLSLQRTLPHSRFSSTCRWVWLWELSIQFILLHSTGGRDLCFCLLVILSIN